MGTRTGLPWVANVTVSMSPQQHICRRLDSCGTNTRVSERVSEASMVRYAQTPTAATVNASAGNMSITNLFGDTDDTVIIE